MLLFDESKNFYKGNLHTHTTGSDGALSPEEVMKLYCTGGYDFLALTDHRTCTTDTDLYKGMLILPGIELDYTMPLQVVHLVGIGITRDIETAQWASAPQAGIDAIRRFGGVAILAHPHWSLNTLEMVLSLQNLAAAEVYNSTSRSPWNPNRADSTHLLDMAATHGRLLPTVASDDAHWYNGDACRSFTMVNARENSAETIMQALKEGAFFASQGPKFTQISYDKSVIKVHCSKVKRVLFHTNAPYAPVRAIEGDDLVYAEYAVHPAWKETYVRVILEDENGLRAWANPFPLA